jgi:hypothetical protein
MAVLFALVLICGGLTILAVLLSGAAIALTSNKKSDGVGCVGWLVADAPRVAMGDIAPLVRRPVTIDPDGSYPELGVRSFGKGTFHKPQLPGIEVGTKKLFTVESGDLVFNIVFAWEGAVAVASSGDAGRVGSHRFLTCVPDPDRATADFLRFWFLGDEGMLALGQASPGGAGRNRTLGIKALEAIKVPVPSLEGKRCSGPTLSGISYTDCACATPICSSNWN